MTYQYKKTIQEFNIKKMAMEVETFCEQNEVPANKLFSIQLIIEELVTNIIKYGKAESEEAVIEIKLAVKDASVMLTIADNSDAFNPLEHETADTKLSAEERSIGGLGLFLVRKKVKSLSYEHKDGFNIVKAEV